MVINFPAMTFKMFPKNIFFCRSDIYKCKDFLFFSLPLKSTTEHECTLNFRKFLKIPTTIGSKVTSCVDNSFWNVFIPLISDLLCGQHNKLPYNRIINIVVFDNNGIHKQIQILSWQIYNWRCNNSNSKW